MNKHLEDITKWNGHRADVTLPVAAGVRGEDFSTAQQGPDQIVNAVAPSPEPELRCDEFRILPLNVKPGSPLVVLDPSSTAATEQYRIVRTRILHNNRRTKLLLISSAGPNDGKTVSAINIASVLALREAKVLLIDADLRRSSIAAALGIPNKPGLSEVLSGERRLTDVVVQAEQNPNLHILTAGDRTSNPAELLDSPHWRELCSRVRERFDFVVLDAPPIAAVADYELLQASSDSVIVIVRPDHTDKSMCMGAIGLIPEDKLLGVVVNCAFNWVLCKSHHPYEYYGAQTGSNGSKA
jgi:capsular exopolysaccharide synthesis family protein